MRITPKEQQTFIDVLGHYINESAELRLFGGRVNDHAKGGDIDLLVIVTSDKTAENLMYYKARILSEIKNIIGEQKIDLLISTFNKQDVFVQIILPESIILQVFKQS